MAVDGADASLRRQLICAGGTEVGVVDAAGVVDAGGAVGAGALGVTRHFCSVGGVDADDCGI